MKLNYRPEIDGLRAIAVGAVILYHAQISILGYSFAGGFIGVDIFFVISGYLITSIILKELITTGSFSFKNFYQRRVRRILPALLFVMLASLPFAWMFFLTSSFVDFSKSILYSLGFSSNFYFHYSGQEYGAYSGLLKPFLHTWSLSVEEQFYILFPLVFIVIFRYFRKYLIHTLILGFIISLGLADWGSRNYTSVTFYFPHTRMWELLAGSILAYFEISLGHRSEQKTLNLILPSLGLILIGYSILSLNDGMFHPSFYTLPSVIGVCLIIWFSNKDELITRLLSTKLFVGIGLISYSLYLWHYPVFAFSRVTKFAEYDIFKKLLLGVIILILSIISYYFIERPARNINNKFRVIISLIIISLVILITFNSNIILKEGFKNRLPRILQKDLTERPWELLKNSEGKPCHGNYDGCKFNISSKNKVHLIGDSHMAAIMFDLKDKVVKKDYQFTTSTVCNFFPGFNLINVKTKRVDSQCNNNYFIKLKETLSNETNSIIIIGGRFPAHLSNYLFDNQEGGVEGKEGKEMVEKFVSIGKYETISSSFKNEVLELSKNNKIILIYPIPEVGWHVANKIWIDRKNKFSRDFDLQYVTTSYEVYQNRTKTSFELLDSIKNENIYRVYPHSLFCNTVLKDRCVTHDDKNLFYFDDNHPSLKGSEMINNLIIKKINEIKNVDTAN